LKDSSLICSFNASVSVIAFPPFADALQDNLFGNFFARSISPGGVFEFSFENHALQLFYFQQRKKNKFRTIFVPCLVLNSKIPSSRCYE